MTRATRLAAFTKFSSIKDGSGARPILPLRLRSKMERNKQSRFNLFSKIPFAHCRAPRGNILSRPIPGTRPFGPSRSRSKFNFCYPCKNCRSLSASFAKNKRHALSASFMLTPYCPWGLGKTRRNKTKNSPAVILRSAATEESRESSNSLMTRSLISLNPGLVPSSLRSQRQKRIKKAVQPEAAPLCVPSSRVISSACPQLPCSLSLSPA